MMAALLRIDWGPLPNVENDVGTDMWVQAADEHGELLARLVGVQVKTGCITTGSSCFRWTGEENGEAGWWYYESDSDHFDDWLNYNTPHLIVLHDLKTRASHWAHVKFSAVRATGQGRKIFVPASQTIDDDHKVALRDVALSHGPPPSFEGTALGPPPGTVPSGCELRYALIAPRLVAPHPNFESERPISAAEGVALLAQGRFRGLRNRSDQHEDVPDPEDPDAAGDWTWRFVAAIWDWAINDSTELLEVVFGSAPDRRSATASGVFFACALARRGRHRDTITALTPLAEDVQLDPVDRAWVLVQRARARAEIGDLQECCADALAARELLASDNNDMTVSAIAAAVEWHLSITASAEDRDYRPIVAASDTTASWWRWQKAGWGLASAVDAGFRQWAQELSVTFGGAGGHGETELFGAELCADLAGEHAAWKTLASLGARLRIQHAAGSSDEMAELVEGLEALRCCGDDRPLQRAIGRLLWDGPIDAAVAAVSRVRPDEWTRTTVPTNFALLESAGDLLAEHAATELHAWVSYVVGAGIAEFMDLYQPTVTVSFAAHKAMEGMMPAAASSVHSSIAALIASLPIDLPDVMARPLANQMDWMDFDSVNDASRAALRQAAFAQRSFLSTRILGWLAANGDIEALDRLKSQAADGDLDALAEIADVQLLNDTEAVALISVLDERAHQALSEMMNGRHDTGSLNTLDALTLLNLRFPEAARWSAIHEVLSEPRALADQKAAICIRVAALSESLPASERDLLTANLDAVAAATDGFWPGRMMAGIDVVLAVALGAIGSDEANAEVTRLALGAQQQRTNAAKLLGFGHCPGMRPILTQLIRDPGRSVRREAARSIGKLTARTPDALCAALARDVAHSPGMHLPSALIDGLSLDSPQPNETSKQLAVHFLDHSSARIRHKARQLLQP